MVDPDESEQEPEQDPAEELDLAGDDDGELDELSLDDLGAAYARVAAEHDPEAFAAPESGDEDSEASDSDHEEADDLVSAESDSADEEEVVTPEAIIEAALFIGHPESRSVTEQRLASLMRGMTPKEVVALIDQLNASYREADQALRIIKDEQGYRMTIAPEVENVRRSFLGKVREARLSQAAIEVLSLVAYQPGIVAQTVQDQRGRESGPILNQLVRRQLLRMEREKPPEGGRAIPHYYPTERFLVLFELESLDDLPQVEEAVRE